MQPLDTAKLYLKQLDTSSENGQEGEAFKRFKFKEDEF